MKTTLFDLENWKEIGATLSRNRTRTFLTGFGIFWGVAMLAILMGGARGAEDMLRRNFSGFATNSAFLWGGRTTIPYKGQAKDRFWQLDLRDVERLRLNIPEIETLAPSHNEGGISFKHDKYSYSAQLNGVNEDYSKVVEPIIVAGRFISENDELLKRKVVVLGQKIVGQIFPTDPKPVGQTVEIGGIGYTIIGVVKQTNEVSINGSMDESAFIPASVFRRAFNRGETVEMLTIVAKPGQKLAELKPRIQRVLYSRHDISPDDDKALSFFDISENFEMVDSLFRGISLLAMFIGVSTLLAGIIGIGNIMWVIVKERTQEIGVRRALGAKPRDIITQILSEGMMLTAVAGVAGICFATVALGITQHLTANEISIPRFQMSLWQALEIMLTFIVLGTAAGLIPSIKAMRIKPIEALNDK